MSIKVGELYASMALDKRNFDQGLAQSERAAHGWAGRVGGSLSRVAGALLKWGTIAGVAAAGGAYVAANAASDLAETVSKVGVVFGSLGSQMIDWSKDSATALGMSQNEALTAAGTYGNLFRSMGMTEKKSADMSQNLVQLAADLASFNNQDPTEVMEKLRAGLVGEVMPLRSLGVNLNQALIEQRALELGLWDGKGAIDANAKAQASYSLILEQTALAQGDFERTSKGMANQQRILKAVFKDTVTAVGAAFMPLIVQMLPKVIKGLQRFKTWVTDNMPEIQAVVEGAMAGIGLAFDLAFRGVHLLIEGIQWFSDNVLPHLKRAFGDISQTAGPALSEALAWISDNAVPALGAAFQWFMDNIMPSLTRIWNTFTEVVLPPLLAGLKGIGKWVADNWPTISDLLTKAFDAMADALEIVAPILVSLGEVILPILGAALSTVLDWINKNSDAIKTVLLVALGAWITKIILLTILTGVNAVLAVAGLITKIGLMSAAMWANVTAAGALALAWAPLVAAATVIVAAIGLVSAQTNSAQKNIDKGRPGVTLPFDWLLGNPTTGEEGLLGMPFGGPPKTKPKLPKLPFGFKFPFEVPGYAAGTVGAPGGWAMVGERGPELLNLPGGSRVYPHGQGPAGAGGISIGQLSVSIYGVGSDVSPSAARRFGQDVMDEFTARLRDQSAQVVRVKPVLA